jgi:hypothetical protein
MVKISLPILDGVTAEQVREFYAAHLPNSCKFEVAYHGPDCILTVSRAHAGACNVLYYSIPDYLACAC